jgi:GT2 family glycosyltransferase
MRVSRTMPKTRPLDTSEAAYKYANPSSAFGSKAGPALPVDLSSIAPSFRDQLDETCLRQSWFALMEGYKMKGFQDLTIMRVKQQQSQYSTLPSSQQPTPQIRLAVGLATRGRPLIVAETIANLQFQSRQPDSIVVAYADPADIGDAPQRFPQVCFVKSELGLTRQRNTILETLADEDLITFIDDDFYLHRDYLAITEQVFATQPEIMVATGKLLADGINGPGLTAAEAKAMLAVAVVPQYNGKLTAVFNAYGCNMSLRMGLIRTHKFRFDENLPLYGWYEDVDFSRQLAPHGGIVRVENAYGVHLGTKSGRQSGFKLGYSQVANPFYLARKRTVSWRYAVASMLSRSVKNLVKSATPEPFVDRRGRLCGNVQAWRELLSGTISPSRITKF